MKHKKFAFALFAFMFLVIALSIIISYASVAQIDVVIKEKWIKASGSDSQKYFFSVSDGNGALEVLENTDSIYFLKFNSSDVYANLQPGDRINARVFGWRIPFMSWYRDIISYEKN